MYFPTSSAGESTDSSVGDASRSDLSAALFHSQRFEFDPNTLQFSMGYSFGMTFLDGEPPLADINHIFVEKHGGYLGLQWRGKGNSSLRIGYAFTREAFADLPRSNWGNEISLEYSTTSLASHLTLMGWVAFRHESAFSPDYDAVIPNLGFGVSMIGPWDLVLGFRAGYEHENHFNSDGGRWGKPRRDNGVDITVELGRAIGWGLRVRAIYQRLQNMSTVESYHYSRDFFSTTVSWSY